MALLHTQPYTRQHLCSEMLRKALDLSRGGLGLESSLRRFLALGLGPYAQALPHGSRASSALRWE